MKRMLLFVLLSLISVIVFFEVKGPSVEITGASEVLTDQLLERLQASNWLITSSRHYEELLGEHPLVAAIQVDKRFFNRLKLSVEMEKPFAAVKSGRIYVMISSEGIVMSLAQESEAPYVIDGFKVDYAEVGHELITENSDLIVKAVQLVDLYQKYTKIKPNVHLIAGDLIQKINPKLWVNFGKGFDIAKQFNVAMSIYDDMKSKQSNTGIINLSVPGQSVIQTWKN